MLSLASAIRHLPFELRHSPAPRHVFYSSASEQNEPTFYRGDSAMALFINPCEHTTYVHSTPRKGAPRKKRFYETNLTLGEIGKMGKPYRPVLVSG